MIRQALEKKLGKKLSDGQFKDIMQMATDDIRVNRIDFNKKTRLEDVIIIAQYCYLVL
ncbi:hypothetical protein SAMN05443428_1544 [Caloramator quimbayensis]|uniref:Uncharacterized protein n=1 Tax=Caloramator quimbayensis TaxID=1147123 RepID=A0A1T4YHA3_9CLOT|nr:hypothetical protein [Caloramator quimbayensis]SKB01159.1 hypothetical protein SAMN05443428_1544 [Caloramator quimbayensis]